jgi:hypothetical protein
VGFHVDQTEEQGRAGMLRVKWHSFVFLRPCPRLRRPQSRARGAKQRPANSSKSLKGIKKQHMHNQARISNL